MQLKKKGVFAAVLIKKGEYWPKHVPGDVIIAHFNSKEVSSMDALHGVMDGVHEHICAMKEPDYTVMLMTSYRTFVGMADERK